MRTRFALVFWLMTLCARGWLTAVLLAQTPEKGSVRVAEAPAQAEKGSRWAVLVSVGDYPDAEGYAISKLIGPPKDADDLRKFLTDPQRGRFPEDHVVVLKDREATKDNILFALNDLVGKTTRDDLVVFFFSGHGWKPSIASPAYLIPYATNPRYLRGPQISCIDFDDLEELIAGIPAEKVVVLLDACHAGGIRSKDAKDLPGNPYSDFLFQTSKGIAFLLSSDETQESIDEPQGGVFTQHLLKGLRGEADANRDRVVTYDEAAKYVETTVPEYVRSRYGKTQQPTRRYGAAPVQGEIPLADLRDLFRQEQRQTLRRRVQTLVQAGIAGLSPALERDGSDAAQRVYEKALQGETPDELDLRLVAELDRLAGKETPLDKYALVAQAIHDLRRPAPTSQLRLSLHPADATARLASVDTPETALSSQRPNEYRLPRGRYSLTVERPGYKPLTRELNLTQEEEAVPITLTQLTGILNLDVTPADAKVTIEPVEVLAPDPQTKMLVVSASGQSLPIGTYRVTAAKEGYEPLAPRTVQIQAEATARVQLRLTPIQQVEPPQPIRPTPTTATISYADMPPGTRVFVDGEAVALPHTAAAGPREIRLEREGFEPITIRESLAPGQALPLRPEWIAPVTPPAQPGVTRRRAFVSSLLVPGLGQHLQKRHTRGLAYEVLVAAAGAAALGATLYHQTTLEDYNLARSRVQEEAPQYIITPNLQNWQEDAYDTAKSARNWALWAQIAAGIAWGLNAVDAVGTARQTGVEWGASASSGRSFAFARIRF